MNITAAEPGGPGAPTEPGEWGEWVLARIGRTSTARLPIAEAHGRTFAAEARAQHDLPLWDNSAMDGYALRAADTAGATDTAPVQLQVTDEVLAGSAADPAIAPGCAVRIMTGAPVPSDADAVVPFEQTPAADPAPPVLSRSKPAINQQAGPSTADFDQARDHDAVWTRDAVQLTAPVAEGANIRRRGEDIAAGTPIANAGELLTAARLSALAAAGVAEVEAHVLPQVAVLVTGSELRPVGAELARGQIVESNALLVSGLLRECGIEYPEVRQADDDPAAVRRALDELARSHDVVITTGGIGPGSHDVMSRIATAEPGVRSARLAMRPAKLQCAGRLASGAWLFALTGNPVSAAVSFELFVRPALLALQGRAEVHRPRLPGIAAIGWRGARDRLQIMPVTLDGAVARSSALSCRPAVNPRGVSHAVGGHGATQAYALVGPEHGDIEAGDPVELLLVAP